MHKNIGWLITIILVFALITGARAYTPETRNEQKAQEKKPPASQDKETAKQKDIVKKADPKKALELLDKGELAFASSQFEKARRLWKQALEARPGWKTVEERLVNLDRRAKIFKKEMILIKKRREARLDFVDGINAFNAGDYKKAVAAFERHLTVFPDSIKGQEYLNLAKKWAAETK